MGGEAPSNDPLPDRPQEVLGVLHPAQATPSDNPPFNFAFTEQPALCQPLLVRGWDP